MSVPAGQMQGRPVMSRGSQAAKDLLARLFAAANVPSGVQASGLSNPQRFGVIGAAEPVFGFSGPRLISHLMRLGMLSPGPLASRRRGVPPSPGEIAASYQLSGSPLVSNTPGMTTSLGESPSQPFPGPSAGFSVAPGANPAPVNSPMVPSGPFAGQPAVAGGPFGMPEPLPPSPFARSRPPRPFVSWAEAMAHGVSPYRR